MADVTGHSLYTLVWQLKQFISTVSLWHVSTWMVYLGERLMWAEHFYIGCCGNDNITSNINNSTSLTLFLFLSSIWVVLQQWVHENKHYVLCLHHQKEIQAYFEFLEKVCIWNFYSANILEKYDLQAIDYKSYIGKILPAAATTTSTT